MIRSVSRKVVVQVIQTHCHSTMTEDWVTYYHPNVKVEEIFEREVTVQIYWTFRQSKLILDRPLETSARSGVTFTGTTNPEFRTVWDTIICLIYHTIVSIDTTFSRTYFIYRLVSFSWCHIHVYKDLVSITVDVVF